MLFFSYLKEEIRIDLSFRYQAAICSLRAVHILSRDWHFEDLLWNLCENFYLNILILFPLGEGVDEIIENMARDPMLLIINFKHIEIRINPNYEPYIFKIERVTSIFVG